jgi:hypothetical protein
MKRNSEQQDVANETKRTKLTRLTLVVLPGASGTVSKATQLMLDELGQGDFLRILKKERIAWNTSKPEHKKNIEIVNELLADLETEQFAVLGNSFGNRVILSMVRDHKFETTPSKIVFCGYPLLGPKEGAKNDDRKSLLKVLKDAHIKTAFVSGESDEFLNRSYSELKGKELLESCIADAGISNARTFYVKDGKHSVPECKGKQEQKNAQRALTARFLIDFLSDE